MVSILATAIIMVLALPISRVFVGEYPATVALAQVILGFMVGLLPFSLLFMLQRAFYALEDTQSPFWFTVLQISIYVLGAWFINWLVPAPQVVLALALLTSISVCAQAATAYMLLRRKIGSLAEFGLLRASGRFFAAAAVAAGLGWATLEVIGTGSAASFALRSVLNAGIASIAVAVVMVLTYLLVLRLLKSRETDAMFELVRGIVRR
jgi:putative peptidoglycan lipid II flippase